MRAFLATWLVIASAPSADAKCARMGLAPSVLTPSGATISPDGGIVVGVVDVQSDDVLVENAAAQPGWRIKHGSRVDAPKMVVLAPGLVLYKLPADAKDGQLIDHKRAAVGSVIVGAKQPAIAAPKLKAVKYESQLGRRPWERVTVELGAAAPAGAIAIVLTDPKGNVRSWGRVVAGKTTLVGYDHGGCRVLADDTLPSKPGSRVAAFWVDASGRKSALSAPAGVEGAKPADSDDE